MWRLPKAETPWWKERQPNLGFWNKCHLLIKRLRHPNLGFCSQCVTCWSNGGDNSPSWKLELRFLKSLSLADQKMETTHQWKLELRFLKSVSHADQKVETPWSKSWDTQSRDTLIKRCRHPNLGFWSQCCLLIKWWRQLPLVKVGI